MKQKEFATLMLELRISSDLPLTLDLDQLDLEQVDILCGGIHPNGLGMLRQLAIKFNLNNAEESKIKSQKLFAALMRSCDTLQSRTRHLNLSGIHAKYRVDFTCEEDASLFSLFVSCEYGQEVSERYVLLSIRPVHESIDRQKPDLCEIIKDAIFDSSSKFEASSLRFASLQKPLILTFLQNLPITLRALSVDRCALDANDIKDFTRDIVASKSLSKLEFGEERIEGHAVEALAEVIIKNRSIKILRLNYGTISEVGIKYLIATIYQHGLLVSLERIPSVYESIMRNVLERNQLLAERARVAAFAAAGSRATDAHKPPTPAHAFTAADGDLRAQRRVLSFLINVDELSRGNSRLLQLDRELAEHETWLKQPLPLASDRNMLKLSPV